MRITSLIAVAVVLLGSITGISRAYTVPVEVTEQVVVLNYEQKGEFDYLARVKASYLSDDIPLEISSETNESPAIPPSPPTTPKYPAEIVERFNITFTYEFAPDNESVRKISEEVEVTAVLDRKNLGQESIVLVPATNQTGDVSVGFSLDGSDLASSYTTTITATVYTTAEITNIGPMFESFTQNLTIQSKGPLLEVDKNLAAARRASFGDLTYEQIGEFDYSVHLKPESPFGDITLRPPVPSPPPPPPPPQPLSSKTLGPEDALYSKLFDSMDITFSYTFEADKPISQIDEEVEINAVLENPEAWSKSFILVPSTVKNGPFSIDFQLEQEDFEYFNEVYKTIERETGDSFPRKIAIKADVHTIAQTDFGLIDEKFSQTISTSLGGDIINWEGDFIDSKPATIERTRTVPNPDKIVGLPINVARISFVTLASIAFILLLFLVLWNVWLKPEILPFQEKEALRARKKYRNVVVDVRELPEAEVMEMVIRLGSLDAIIKTADNLLKPVLHMSEGDRHTYCVIDGFTRYEYVSED